jgi:hypothetical protein
MRSRPGSIGSKGMDLKSTLSPLNKSKPAAQPIPLQ